MAEEEHMWSQRHAHESSTISYGQFGTPVYQSSSQDWEFPRKDHFEEAHEEDATEQEGDPGLLNVLTSPEIVFESASINVSDLVIRNRRPQVKDFPDLAAASPLIKVVDKDKAVDIPTSHQGDRIAFGSALCLSASGVDSGNLVVPVVAYATGSGTETLRLACLGQEQFQYQTEDDSPLEARVPSLFRDPQVSSPGIEPILQLSFSQRDAGGHADTFLLVRRASQTSIFEPLLHRGVSFHAPGQRGSSIDPNPLVTLHASVTGGHRHVDSAFHPLDHRKVAIVDDEGNWSIWKIRGRRSATARMLYQARLKAFGKVFSWKHKKRPKGMGLFFDGWHRVVWISSDGDEVDRLLVCNRQTIKLFTLTGQELYSVDPRLDVGKASYILDIRSGPSANLCLILTTSKLLVFDIRQQEWKDPVSAKGPALLCAFQHFQNPADMSLRLTDVPLGDDLLLVLYSVSLHSLSIRQLTFSEADGKTSTTVSDPWSLTLPRQLLGSQMAAIILGTSEIAYARGHSPRYQQELLRVIIQYEDSSVYSFWAAARVSSRSRKSATKPPLLRLPPNRNLQRKSRQRVDDADEEDDFDGFIVSCSDHEDDLLDENDKLPRLSLTVVTEKVKMMKYVDEIYGAIIEQRSNNMSQSTIKTVETSKRLESRLQDIATSKYSLSRCVPVSELIEDAAKIGDVEAESNILQQTVSSLGRDAAAWKTSFCHGRSTETLLSVYSTMFNTFVDGLPPNVPDRSRVQKERQCRGVALEQYLSSYTIRRHLVEMKVVPENPQAASDASQMIFSDPLQHNHVEGPQLQSLSASQPLPQIMSEPSSSSVVLSPLLDSLSHLRSYTKITRDFGEDLADDLDKLNYFSSVLSHLPISCEEKPDDYDYQGSVMANAAEKAETHGQNTLTSGQAKRRAARLAKIRNRAEGLSNGIYSSPNLHSGSADKEPGNFSRGIKSSGQRSQDRNAGSLPIRNSGERFPGLAWRDSVVAQTQQAYHLSDGHLPAESSSQAAMRPNITLTQPERGTFANRAESKGQEKTKKKKKKKRIAGF